MPSQRLRKRHNALRTFSIRKNIHLISQCSRTKVVQIWCQMNCKPSFNNIISKKKFPDNFYFIIFCVYWKCTEFAKWLIFSYWVTISRGEHFIDSAVSHILAEIRSQRFEMVFVWSIVGILILSTHLVDVEQISQWTTQ